MLMGDHPQSYLQPHFELFGLPRRRHSTVLLQQKIGFVSPELFNAFPRRGMTVRESIATGLHSTFSYRPRTAEDDARIDALLAKLGPERWSGDAARSSERFAEETFARLPAAEQALVLLMRALVAKAPLVILDEAFAGMNEEMVRVAKMYLREELEQTQAVIFVTHWEEEVPWSPSDVRRMALVEGRAVES